MTIEPYAEKVYSNMKKLTYKVIGDIVYFWDIHELTPRFAMWVNSNILQQTKLLREQERKKQNGL